MSSLSARRRRLEATKHMDENYSGSDIRSGKAFQSEWVNCRFENIKSGLLDIRASRIIDTAFVGSSMYGTVFTGAYLRNVTFTECDLEQATFAGVVFDNVIFDECRLAYSSFTGGIVRRALRLRTCNLHGADFDIAEAPDHTLLVTGCNLWGVKIPIGCPFWNGEFDQDTVDKFIAMTARACPDKDKAEILRNLSGKYYEIIHRAMGGEGNKDE